MVQPVWNAGFGYFLWSTIWSAVWTIVVSTWRFWSGAHMDGKVRTDATWTHEGTRPLVEGERMSWWAAQPRLGRAGIRATAVAATLGLAYAYLTDPANTRRGITAAAIIAAALLLRTGRRAWKARHHRRRYVKPLSAVLGPALGWADGVRPARWLSIPADLRGLDPKPPKPLSPFEEGIRRWYGQHIEPVIRYIPDRIMLTRWKLAESTTGKLSYFQRPIVEAESVVQVKAQKNLFVGQDIKMVAGQMVREKLGIELEGSWNQVGNQSVGTWTVVKHPPEKATYEGIEEVIDSLKEHEFFCGWDPNEKPFVIDLNLDSPHLACSAGTGGGKSVLAMLIAIQVLRRGGLVDLLDMKGSDSHRWARNMPGVNYCRTPAQIHDALIAACAEAKRRNDEAYDQPEGWDPGPRKFIIFEELNATIARLKRYWDSIREPSDPKQSPAIDAFHELMYMGRSAKTNIFGVAQMLTAKATGGPEARENFGIRWLCRYTANAWKMLAPECRMPRKSKIHGRWECVIAGDTTSVQVAFGSMAEARRVATGGKAVPVVPVPQQSGTARSDLRGPGGTSPVRDAESHADATEAARPTSGPPDPFAAPVTLSEALAEGYVDGDHAIAAKWLAIDSKAPQPAGHRGDVDVYKPVDLVEWNERAVTLTEALEDGCVNGNYEAVKKRLKRDANAPEPVGKRGNANLYKPIALLEWSERANK